MRAPYRDEEALTTELPERRKIMIIAILFIITIGVMMTIITYL
nr:MAG TPA: hypothetical protein [Caudoviricetes sp.]